MSFFNSKTWAKIPTDLLTNKAMERAEKALAPDCRFYPVMLYLAAAGKADNDGIFNAGDCGELSALIKAESPATVRQVLDAMTANFIFAHVPDSTVYLFSEWDYTGYKACPPLSQRMATAQKIWEQLRSERSYYAVKSPEKPSSFSQQSTKIDMVRKNLASPESTSNYTVNGGLNLYGAKADECLNPIQPGAEGGAQIRREREERENRADNTRADENTHTERVEGVGEERESAPAYVQPESTPAGAEKRESETEQTQSDSEISSRMQIYSVTENVLPDEKPCEGEEREDAFFVPENGEKNAEKTGGIETMLTEFFKKVNPAYDSRKGGKHIQTLSAEIGRVALEMEADLEEVAAMFCTEFKKMHDSPAGSWWHDIPLLPLYMGKEAVWNQLLSRVGTSYEQKHGSRKKLTDAEYMRLWQEHQKDLARPANSYESEFLRYGISPEDPDRARKLLMKKSGEVRNG